MIAVLTFLMLLNSQPLKSVESVAAEPLAIASLRNLPERDILLAAFLVLQGRTDEKGYDLFECENGITAFSPWLNVRKSRQEGYEVFEYENRIRKFFPALKIQAAERSVWELYSVSSGGLQAFQPFLEFRPVNGGGFDVFETRNGIAAFFPVQALRKDRNGNWNFFTCRDGMQDFYPWVTLQVRDEGFDVYENNRGMMGFRPVIVIRRSDD